MRWARAELRRAAHALLMGVLALLATGACERGRVRDDDATGDAPRPDTGRALQLADPELSATCDSLEQWVRDVVPRGAQRSNGRFIGAARGATRYGCRITATDVLAPDVPQRPLETVWQKLAGRGWTVEQEYVADSPEGSMLGLRSGSVLCVLQHSWQAGSDDERAARPDVPVPYEIAVECFREASRAADTARLPGATVRLLPRSRGLVASRQREIVQLRRSVAGASRHAIVAHCRARALT